MAIDGLGTASGSGFVTQATLDATVGLVPITPTSIANSGGSASASGGAVTFSGVTSVSLNGVFTSTYVNYRVFIDAIGSGSSVTSSLRFRASGTDNTTANYQTLANYVARSSASIYRVLDSSYWDIIGMTTGNTNRAVIDVMGPQLATQTHGAVTAIGYTNQEQSNFGGYLFGATTQFDGLTFYVASGTITGTIRIYGYRN